MRVFWDGPILRIAEQRGAPAAFTTNEQGIYLTQLARLIVPRCHRGHSHLPITLWDCPDCTEATRKELAEVRAELERITAAGRG